MAFYQINAHILKIVETDYRKILLHHYIIRAENLQRISKDLPRGHFKITLRNISMDLKISISTTRRILKELESIGVIKCIKKSKSCHEASIYKYIFDNKHETVDEPVKETVNGTVNPSDYNLFDCIGVTVDETVNVTVDGTSKKELNKKNIKKDTYALIIDKLNKEAKKSFRANTSKTKSLINARLKEGFSIEDFFTVIEVKSSQWKNNNEMKQFLRPETLFSNKFEAYLNEVPIKENKSEVYEESPWCPDFDYEM